MAEERLQKILARAGVTSRRKAEALITAGRVRVDGKIVTELGAKANPRRAAVELDGRRLEPEPFCYGIFHKPRGMVTTASDPEGRPTAQDVLRQVGVRVVTVGRLDFNTSGALLFTNDGDFAQALSHAKGNVPKVYAAKVSKPMDEKSLERWRHSIDIEGKKTRPAEVRMLRREGDKTWLEVTIKEGKNRQVRRLGEHAGTPVDRLARLSHAGISAEGLRPGEWRLLTTDELKELKKNFGVPEKIRSAPDLPRTKGSTSFRGGMASGRGAPSRTATTAARGVSADQHAPPSGSRTSSRVAFAERTDRSARSTTKGRSTTSSRSAPSERRDPSGRGASSASWEEAPPVRGRRPSGKSFSDARKGPPQPSGRAARGTRRKSDEDEASFRSSGPKKAQMGAKRGRPEGRPAREGASASRPSRGGASSRSEGATPRGRSGASSGQGKERSSSKGGSAPRSSATSPRGSGSSPRPKKRQ